MNNEHDTLQHEVRALRHSVNEMEFSLAMDEHYRMLRARHAMDLAKVATVLLVLVGSIFGLCAIFLT